MLKLKQLRKNGMSLQDRWTWIQQRCPIEQLVAPYLRDADLRFADLTDAVLSKATLNNADLRFTDLSGATLNSAILSDATLTGAKLRGANLINADLTDADLRKANLRDADLRKANFSKATLIGASLMGASLRGATLTGATLTSANLKFTDLTGADLRGADLSGTCLDPSNPVPELTDQEILDAGLKIQGDLVYGYRTYRSIHVGSTVYDPKEDPYVAPVFSTDTDTDCHPGIYLAGLDWLKKVFSGNSLVRCYCKKEELIHAENKWRCKRLWVTDILK